MKKECTWAATSPIVKDTIITVLEKKTLSVPHIKLKVHEYLKAPFKPAMNRTVQSSVKHRGRQNTVF